MSNEAASTIEKESGRVRAGVAADIAFLIDDDRLMSALLERHLAKRGIRVVGFEDPALLLAALPAAKPAYLFTDLDMPLMRGTELVSRARAGGFTGAIVLVTASRERADFAAAVESGCDEILGKPPREADLDFILAKLRAISRRSSAGIAPPRELLEPIGQGIVLLDEECVPIHINRRAREILGARDEREAGEVLDREGLPAFVMSNRHGDRSINFIDMPAPGGARASRLIGFEIHECAAGAPGRSYLVLMHDFSEWRKLDELHVRFATCLSHRMRTPLTSARNAVMILSEQGALLDGAEKERFLDIGYRNIEKVISSFDELQGALLAEAGEINASRALIKVGAEIEAILGEMKERGAIGGFKMRPCDAVVLTCRSLLRRYVITAVEAIGQWLGAAPSIECAVTANDAAGGETDEPTLIVSIKPHTGSRTAAARLKDHCERGDVPKGVLLEKIARALDGVHVSTDGDAFRLRLPADPPLDREKDLIHPLHMMIERAKLGRVSLHIVSTRMAGASSEARAFSVLFASSLCALCGTDDWLVVRGWKPGHFDVLVAGASRERVNEEMECVRERFARRCRERGEELYPAVRWEIRYTHEFDGAAGSTDCSMLDTLL